MLITSVAIQSTFSNYFWQIQIAQHRGKENIFLSTFNTQYPPIQLGLLPNQGLIPGFCNNSLDKIPLKAPTFIHK